MPILIINFPNYEYLAKTANALRNKPFVEVLGKILNKNALLVIAYLPIYEFFNMLNSLNQLSELGYIEKYKYYLQAFTEKGQRATIPYQNFRDGEWIYKHDEYIMRLYEKLKEVNKKIEH